MTQLKEKARILVVRPDALGDCVLIGPMLSALKLKYPSSHVAVLQQRYTSALYSDSDFVDEVLIDWVKEGKAKGIGGFFAYAKWIRSFHFDAVVFPYTFGYYVMLAWIAGIPIRIGDGNKPLLLPFLTKGIPLNFRDITKHEVEQNCQLLTPFGIDSPGPTAIKSDSGATQTVSQMLCDLGWTGKPLIGIHPTTGGNNRSWTVEGFASVIDQLYQTRHVEIVLTGAGKKDEAFAKELQEKTTVPVLNLAGKTDLYLLKGLMPLLSGFVSSDTGPMHIASACKVPILSLSPSKFVKSTRWGPWNTKAVVIQSAQDCPLVCRPGCLQPYCIESIQTHHLLSGFDELMAQPEDASTRRRSHAFTKSVTIGLVTGTSVSDPQLQAHIRLLTQQGFHVVTRPHSYSIGSLFRWLCVQDIGVLHCVECSTWVYRLLRPFAGLKLYIPYIVTTQSLSSGQSQRDWVQFYMGLFRS